MMSIRKAALFTLSVIMLCVLLFITVFISLVHVEVSKDKVERQPDCVHCTHCSEMGV